MFPLLLAAGPSLAEDTKDTGAERPRARDIGLVVGTMKTGQFNAITDVGGVLVGHTTVIEGEDIRTGITAIIPAAGNLYSRPIPAWIHVGNGYGKLIGETQVREFGEIETPILLTCTLCVWDAADALVEYLMSRPGEPQHTINPVVGETNDGSLNDMWNYSIRPEHVIKALESAKSGPVAEGSVGAGTGTRLFSWKGGIGTSSRVLPSSLGGYTVGVLVQTNFGGTLRINGAPVGRELGEYAHKKQLEADQPGPQPQDGGSMMMVVATDAPLTSRSLNRLAQRAIMGLARTGSVASNGSGDYVIAFSTAAEARITRTSELPLEIEFLTNAAMSPLFTAVVEATEESIYNALFKATTVSGRGITIEAIPLDETIKILRKYRVLGWDRTLPPGR